MNIVVSREPRMIAMDVTEELIIAELADGRTISVRGMLSGVPARPPKKHAALS